MAFELSRHPFFEANTDASGVVSHILTQRVAPVQQTFYYTNPSITADERLLWFYCGHPPNPQRTLGVLSLDPASPFIRHFPQAGFSAVSPMVDGDGVFLCSGASVWRLGVEGDMQRIFSVPEDYLAGRPLFRLATHLTLDATGHWFLLDGEVGNCWFVALAHRQTGEFRVVKEFAQNFNHAQFHPFDPEVFTIAMDHFRDKSTGRRFHYDNRIWLMDVHNRRFRTLTPDNYASHLKGACHEWWSADGKVLYIDYETGVWMVDPARPEAHELIWPTPLCHAHCDRTRRYFCADQSPYYWKDRPCEVKFFDSATRHSINIASALPMPSADRGLYHIDPHPQFSPRDTWVVYTTTVRGGVADVALCESAGLAARTAATD